MTLIWFLLVCLLAMTALWWSGFWKPISGKRRPDLQQTSQYLIWLVLGLAGLWTVDAYTFPRNPDRFFSNLEYHLLEHEGFVVGETVWMSHFDPEMADMVDGLDGQWWIEAGEKPQMHFEGFYEPVFIENDGVFQLVNPMLKGLVGEDWSIGSKEGPLLGLRVTPSEDSVRYEVDFQDGKGWQVSAFNRLLYRGYPLSDILRQVSGWENHRQTVELMEGSWLIREKRGDANSGLHFFPSRLQVDSLGLSVEAVTPVPLDHGQRFFVGIGLDKGQVYSLTVDGQLNLDFPVRYRLAQEANNELFICSDFADAAQEDKRGGFLFPYFKENAHPLHVYGSLRYARGDARTPLEMWVTDQQAPGEAGETHKVAGGERFELLARDGSHRWRFRLADLRADNPIQPIHLRFFVLGFVLLVFVLMWFQSKKSRNPLELAVYALLFGFLVVRIILQWRMGTFPPVEDVRPSEWAFLRSGRHFWITVASAFGFFVLRFWFLADGPLDKARVWVNERLEDLWENKNKLFLRFRDALEGEVFYKYAVAVLALFGMIWLPLALLKGLGLEQLERFLNIAFPICFFLFLAHLNAMHRNPGRRYHFRKVNPFALFNGALVFFYLSLADAGFSIVFLLFLLIWESFRRTWSDVHGSGKGRKLGWLLVPGTILLLVLILLVADQAIAFIFEWPALFYWLGLLPVIGLGSWYFGGLVLDELGKEGPVWNWSAVATVVLVLVALSPIGIQKIENLSYVRFRAEIHNRDLDQIIERERFDSGQMGQVLRASQNQWFINNYLQEPLEKERGGAFNLRQHFNKGSSYTTQTTDLVVTRYVIAEHGSLVIFLMILGWLLLAVGFFFTYSLKKAALVVPLGALLLLFAISLFIWLTATNRFVFFGQDFPLISLTSLFTLVFSLGLLSFVLVKISGQKFRFEVKSPRLLLPGTAFLGLILFLALGNPVLRENTFNFNLSFDNARAELDVLDEQFVAFQDTFSGEIPLDSMVKVFAKTLPDPQVSESAFTQSVWEHFVAEQKDKANPDELLHVVLRRGRHHLAMNRSYYLIRPPRERRVEWQGNLLAASEGTGTFLVDLRNRGQRIRVGNGSVETNLDARIPGLPDQVNCSVLPKTWTPDQKPLLLINASDGGASGPAFYLSNQSQPGLGYAQGNRQPTLRMQSGDLLTIPVKNGKTQRYRYLEDHRQFLARNLWLNGERRWFYPLGEKLLWAYYYANAIEGAYLEAGKPATDVSVSIDYGLTEELSQKVERRFREEKWERQRLGVVALNGDGQVRLMLDHRLEQVDPNDIREFSDKNREFYLRNNTRLERETFGNINLLKLPNGPGSTLKPIVYSAITSQYKLGWEGLSLETVPAVIRDTVWDQEEGHIQWYGGKEIDLAWSGIGEGDFLRITPREYIVRSRNLYHSVVNFLGAYSQEALQERLTGGKDAILLSPDRKKPELDFPLIGLKGKLWRFNPDAWPETEPGARTFFGSKRSLVAQGLYDNYGLPTYLSKDRLQLDYVDFDPVGEEVFASTRKGHLLFAYPERATFYQERRAVEGPLWFTRGLKQVTAGNDPMRVTPLKMAEMAGRLFRFDRNFKATLGDTMTLDSAQDFVVGNGWTSQSFADFIQQNVYTSMGEVVQRGTGSVLGNWLRARKSGYFYYGKTGTIKNAEDEYSLEDRLLLLVISKGDVAQMSREELRENKFYVVFITGWELDVKPAMKRWEMIFDIVKSVESSYLFKLYMDGKEEI